MRGVLGKPQNKSSSQVETEEEEVLKGREVPVGLQLVVSVHHSPMNEWDPESAHQSELSRSLQLPLGEIRLFRLLPLPRRRRPRSSRGKGRASEARRPRRDRGNLATAQLSS